MPLTRPGTGNDNRHNSHLEIKTQTPLPALSARPDPMEIVIAPEAALSACRRQLIYIIFIINCTRVSAVGRQAAHTAYAQCLAYIFE